jgi:hypothetical protein
MERRLFQTPMLMTSPVSADIAGYSPLRVENGYRSPSRWDGEIPAGINLPQNNQIAIYEMPIKWMSSDHLAPPPSLRFGAFSMDDRKKRACGGDAPAWPLAPVSEILACARLRSH